MSYKLGKYIGVIRLSDEAHIPECEENSDWREYKLWLSKGNVPLPVFSEYELSERAIAEVAENKKMEIELLIKEKLNEIAITELKKEGKLDNEGNVTNDSRRN